MASKPTQKKYPLYLPTVPAYKPAAANKKPDMTGYPLTAEESSALKGMAKSLNIPPEWIYKVILQESGWYALNSLYKANSDINYGFSYYNKRTKKTVNVSSKHVAVGLNAMNYDGFTSLKKQNPKKYAAFNNQQEVIKFYNTRLLQLQNTLPDFFAYQLKTYAKNNPPKTFARFYLLNWLPGYYDSPKFASDSSVVPSKYWIGDKKTLGDIAKAANKKASEMPYSVNVDNAVPAVSPTESDTKKPENKPKETPKPKPKPKTPKPKKVTHYSGEMKKGVEEAITKASSVGGVFYSIFNKYNFYDVADPNNGLTVEQRAQVPPVNQKRFSQMADAFAEMIKFVLGDKQYGVLVNHVQDAVDHLDIRATANAAQLNTIGAGFAAVAPVPIIGQYLAGIDTSRKVAEQATVSAMGSTLIDPKFIPPVSVPNISVPSPVGNLLPKGFIKPDIDFIYSYETVKSSVVYENGEYYAIGAQIPLYENPDTYQIILKQVFGVVGVDGSMTAIGSPNTGIDGESYNTLVSIAPKKVGTLSTTLKKKMASIKLNDGQLKESFSQWFMYKFWNQLIDSSTTLYAHWGFLTNNNLPNEIRTAVASFVWSTKSFTLTPLENDVAAYVSYFFQMGLYYLIGYPNKVALSGMGRFDGDKSELSYTPYLNSNGQYALVKQGVIIEADGVPKDADMANYYFRMGAYTILMSTTSNPSIEYNYRKQRVIEAAMILKVCSDKPYFKTMEYGNVDISGFVTSFNNMELNINYKIPIYRYNNIQSAGTSKDKVLNQNTSNVTVTFQSQVQKTDSNGWILPDTINKLKQIGAMCGMTEINISQTVQTAQEVAEYLFNLEESGIVLQYAPPAQKVVDVYRAYKLRSNLQANFQSTLNSSLTFGLGSNTNNAPITGDARIQVISEMVNVINAQGAYAVSRHAAETIDVYHLRQVIDISMTGSKPLTAVPVFISRLKEISAQQNNPYNLAVFIEPTAKNEDAMHLEFTNVSGSGVEISNALPNVLFNGISNIVYTSGDSGLVSVLTSDANRVKSVGV